MRRSLPLLAFMVMMLCLGVGNLFRYSDKLFESSEKVRTVDVIGLSGAGFLCGVAVVGIIVAIVGGRMFAEDKKPTEKQPSL